MSTQYRLVQWGKTASGGCSAGQGSSEPVAPRKKNVVNHQPEDSLFLPLTSWNRVFLQKLVVVYLVKKFTAVCGTKMFITDSSIGPYPKIVEILCPPSRPISFTYILPLIFIMRSPWCFKTTVAKQ
jgi:hypothetical protein